jgi:hypothetical protein
VCTFGWGCSTSAAVERRNGPTLVGRIDASDVDHLYLTTGSAERFSIERADVVSIDHPGKIGMVIGAVMSGVGLFFLAISPFVRADCGPDYASHAPCWNLRTLSVTIGIGYLLAGIPVLSGNFAVNSRSRAAAAPLRFVAPMPARSPSP